MPPPDFWGARLMSSGPLLQVRSASKRFVPTPSLGDRIAAWLGSEVDRRVVHAVDAVSLDLRQGEVLGLVGESGCGKSTLGRMIAGIYPTSQGEVLLDGKPVMGDGKRPHKTTVRVQMVFQDPFASLDPRVRIGETIAEGPLAHGIVDQNQSRAYVTKWLKAVGLLPDAADRFPHQFSGGQRQRVAIARALAMQPDVLVCDEPLAALDVSIQAQIINLFLKLKHDLNQTMLFISHDLGVVRHMTDRIAVMYLGRIVEQGPTHEVYENPLHPYTRALLDSVPRLATEGSDLVLFKAIEGELPSPLAPPPGCHFHLRCPIARDLCKIDSPDISQGASIAGFERLVACHYPLLSMLPTGP